MPAPDHDGNSWLGAWRARGAMVLAMAGVALGASACLARAQDAASEPKPGARSAAGSPGAAKGALQDAEGLPPVLRVGGDKDAKIEKRGENYDAGACSITTPLPVGYPEPTPPGAIDVKVYPPVRRAEVSGTTMPDIGMYQGFFPLFNHIKKREIAMTSPVEMDYRQLDGAKNADQKSAGRPDATPDDQNGNANSSWTMSFLYRTPELGPTGEDGKVRVRDARPLIVVSLGMKGSYITARVKFGAAKLDAWLDSQDEWEAAGPVRALYYNGPDVAAADLWSEVQIPIRKKSKAPPADAAESERAAN
jgi:hypothetical protein